LVEARHWPANDGDAPNARFVCAGDGEQTTLRRQMVTVMQPDELHGFGQGDWRQE